MNLSNPTMATLLAAVILTGENVAGCATYR